MSDAPGSTGIEHLFEEVVASLRRSPKMLPSKLFYDERGARLFEEITRLPEYYPTRTETGILRTHARAIADWVGPRARIVEFGSGSGEKTRLLLQHLDDPAEYLPVDIAGAQLEAFAARLRSELTTLAVRPIIADYTLGAPIPEPLREAGRTVVFFPGSTIGNLEPAQAEAFLGESARVAGPDGGLLIGIDLQKDVAIIERAYNDAAGVTAAFNRNILYHVNRLFAGDFDPEAFRHHAFYNTERGRIEMHLVCDVPQRVTLHGPVGRTVPFSFDAGEAIVTEYSYKYTVDGFSALAARAGFRPRQAWTDDAGYFAEIAFDA